MSKPQSTAPMEGSGPKLEKSPEGMKTLSSGSYGNLICQSYCAEDFQCCSVRLSIDRQIDRWIDRQIDRWIDSALGHGAVHLPYPYLDLIEVCEGL